jgi:hypothetical protein
MPQSNSKLRFFFAAIASSRWRVLIRNVSASIDAAQRIDERTLIVDTVPLNTALDVPRPTPRKP